MVIEVALSVPNVDITVAPNVPEHVKLVVCIPRGDYGKRETYELDCMQSTW